MRIINKLFLFVLLSICVLKNEENCHTMDSIIATYNQLKTQNDNENIKCLQEHLFDDYYCLYVHHSLLDTLNKSYVYLSSVFAQYFAIEGKSTFYISLKKISINNKVPDDRLDLLQFIYLSCKFRMHKFVATDKILQMCNITDMEFYKEQSDLSEAFFRKLFKSKYKMILFDNCSKNSIDFSFLYIFLLKCRHTLSIDSKYMLLVFAFKFSTEANRKLWSTYNFIANTDKFMQSTNLSKVLLNHFYVYRTKTKSHTYRFTISFFEKNYYYDRKNARNKLKTVENVKGRLYDAINEIWSHYYTTLSDDTCNKSIYITKKAEEKYLQNIQLFTMKIVNNLNVIEFLYVMNKTERNKLLQNNSEYVYRVSIYFKNSKSYYLFFRFFYILNASNDFTMTSQLDLIEKNNKEFLNGQKCVKTFLYLLKTKFLINNYMETNSRLPIIHFNFDNLSYTHFMQIPTLETRFQKENNTYISFFNFYIGLKSLSISNIEIKIFRAFHRRGVRLSTKCKYFKRVFTHFNIYKSIEFSEINEKNFKLFRTLVFCMEYKHESKLKYYYIIIPIKDQSFYIYLKFINKFNDMDNTIKSDKFIFRNYNIIYRAYANKVIKNFLPSYAPEIILWGFKKRMFVAKHILKQLNLYMLRYSIKYKVFTNFKYEMLEKSKIFEWAQALEQDGNLIKDANFQTLLKSHEEMCEFVTIRNIIMMHINALFYQYQKTYERFSESVQKHIILLQSGDYYFQNDQIENIQRLIILNY